MKSKHLLIGLVGQPSSGKDTVADYLAEKYGFRHVSTGDIVRAYTKAHKLGDTTRPVLQEVANRLREQFGADYLAQQALQEDTHNNLVVSGLRNPAEIHTLQAAGAHILVVTASEMTRYKRAKKRGRIGEIDFKTFISQTKVEDHNSNLNAQNIDTVVSLADAFIDNDNGKKALYNKVDELIRQLQKSRK